MANQPMIQGTCNLCKYKITTSRSLVLWMEGVLKKHLLQKHPEAFLPNESLAPGDERVGVAG
jgi:hypothetical protein